MTEPTSTFLTCAEQHTQSSLAQRRLKLAIQLTGVAIGLVFVYGILGSVLDELSVEQWPAWQNAYYAAFGFAPWVATRWTFYGRPLRGGIYGCAVLAILGGIGWSSRDLGTGVLLVALLAWGGMHFFSALLVPRSESVRRAGSQWHAALRAAKFIGYGALLATTLVAGTTTLVLLWYTFVIGRRDATGIDDAWIIAAFLTTGFTVWAGFLGAVYHLRELTRRRPLWRTWRGVKLLTFFGTLLAGLSYVAARPYLATYEISEAGGEVCPFRTYEPTTFGFVCGVTAYDDDFDPRSLSGVRHLYVDAAVQLSSPAIDDDTVAYLRDARNLFALELASPNLTDRSFDVIESLSSLKRLRIAGTRITGKQLSSLGTERFKSLDIDGAPITREGFWAIGQLYYLEQLRLANVHLEEPDVRAVAGLSLLKELTLENVTLGKNALRPMEASPARGLDLWIIGLEPRALPQLAWCPQTTRLDLSNENVTDADLEHLQELRQLVDLDLSNTPIRGAGLRYLTRLPRLRQLFVSGTQVTDSDIFALANMPAMHVVTGERTTEFGVALLLYEQARAQFAEGRIDAAALKRAEREFHESFAEPGALPLEDDVE